MRKDDIRGLGSGLLDGPRGERAVGVRAHELLPFVVPRDGPQRLRALKPRVGAAQTQIPNHDLPRVEADEKLKSKRKGWLLRA